MSIDNGVCRTGKTAQGPPLCKILKIKMRLFYLTKIIRICSLLYENTRNTFVPPNLPVGADLRNAQARACAPCAQPVHSLCTPCALLVHSLCTPYALVLHKVHLVQPCAAPVHPIVFYRKHKKGCTGQKSNVRDEMPFLLCTKKKYPISILNPTTSFKMWVALENIYFTLIVHSNSCYRANKECTGVPVHSLCTPCAPPCAR